MVDKDRPVLILGAGINGAALARELLLNRVPVCLVDTADIASGTTAYSSRLIHGGLRYLEYGDVELVRESLQERARLLKLAPHLVRPLRLFIPVRRRTGGMLRAMGRFLGWSANNSSHHQSRGLWLMRKGLWLYGKYAGSTRLPPGGVHHVGDEHTPLVDRSKYRWLCSYWDGQILHPERLVLALLEDARRLADQGKIWFRIYTYHRASLAGRTIELHRQEGAPGEIAFEPAAIINATGAWVDRTLQRLHVHEQQLIGGTKGSHLVTFHPQLRELLGDSGIYTEAADGRPVFLLPFGRASLIGTTDLPFDEDPALAVTDAKEIDYLLAAVNDVFPQAKLSRDNVDLHYAGVRPLPFADRRTPASTARRHWLQENHDCPVPLYSVIGGKLTTCRSLAEEAAGTILQRLGRNHSANSRDRIIPGGEAYPTDETSLAAEHERLAGELKLPMEQIQAVWSLCGTRTEFILRQAVHPDATPIGNQQQIDHQKAITGTALPAMFVRWIIRNEWVTTLEDLVERRLILLYHPNLSEYNLRQLAHLMMEEGVLSTEEAESQMIAYKNRLSEHFGRNLPV